MKKRCATAIPHLVCWFVWSTPTPVAPFGVEIRTIKNQRNFASRLAVLLKLSWSRVRARKRERDRSGFSKQREKGNPSRTIDPLPLNGFRACRAFRLSNQRQILLDHA
ncbi:unnamed protein product, partial [Hapterophycus canaliculatus]